ncbi:hypothetical protein AURDEDRAFT_112043 [Auricularia subglabra TFB-10046 SS5]|nr:hypothetical protein AURDEDRAFT_112043 [Auricularia subglabra TFB-10046 SS5]
MFAKLCGRDAMPHVVLCSTMWDRLEDSAEGEARERELCASFWHDMIADGAKVARHDGSPASALAVAARVAVRPPVELQLQRELVRDALTLPETAAGQEIGYALLDAVVRQQDELTRLEHELGDAHRDSVQGIRNEMAEQTRSLNARVDDLRLLIGAQDSELEDLQERVERSRRHSLKWILRIIEFLSSAVTGLMTAGIAAPQVVREDHARRGAVDAFGRRSPRRRTGSETRAMTYAT